MSETQSSHHLDEAGALLRDGKIKPALDACSARLRSTPDDLSTRLLLAELLLLAGSLDRADAILDPATRMEPAVAVTVAEFRQLLRAEIARQELDRSGRVPEFLDAPTPALRALLAARVALRAGNHAEAARYATEAERQRPRVPGRAGNTEFDDWRDADDLCAGAFEILTTTGKYFWVPTERVTSVEFVPPRRPRDLVWRRANVSVSEGPDGVVYLPAVYASDDPGLADQFRLGRVTEWREPVGGEDTGLVRGVGLRTFLAGEEAYDIMGLTTVSFTE
jgi:type VI secretion system protein ImpE